MCVCCEVRTGSLNKTDIVPYLHKGLIIDKRRITTRNTRPEAAVNVKCMLIRSVYIFRSDAFWTVRH